MAPICVVRCATVALSSHAELELHSLEYNILYDHMRISHQEKIVALDLALAHALVGRATIAKYEAGGAAGWWRRVNRV